MNESMDTKSIFRISDRTYDILKWIAILGCGLLNELITNIFYAVGVADSTTLMVVRIISAVAICLGGFLGISDSAYHNAIITQKGND